MSIFDRVKKIAAPGRKWPDQPWKKPMPIKRDAEGHRLGQVVEHRDLLETKGSCPICGRSAKVTERWIQRVHGQEGMPFYDRWPEVRIFQCESCGTVLDSFTDAEKDARYQRKE